MRYQGGSEFELYKSDLAHREHFQGSIKEDWSLNHIRQIRRVGSISNEISRRFRVRTILVRSGT